MDPILNWLNGLSAFMVVVAALLYGIFNIRKYIRGKLNSSLYMAIIFLSVAFGWTGITLSFFSILFFGSTLPEVAGIISYFSYFTMPIGSCAVVLLSWDQLFTPKYKKVGFGIFGILYAIYYIFLIFRGK